MNYRIEDLDEDSFESFMNVIYQQILGTGFVSITKSRDVGRDGRFSGAANSYLTNSAPWSGKFLIQAKHTEDYNTNCSHHPFFGNQLSKINKEVEKVKLLLKVSSPKMEIL